MPTNLRDASITRPGTGAVTRTIADRLEDSFCVKEFGAVPNVGGNQAPGIQAAINAAIANGGGTVYFPAGAYDITSRIVIPGSSNAALTLLGDCGRVDTVTGSVIRGTLADYLLYIGHSSKNAPKMPVKRIEGLTFKNQRDASITSTEPPSSPDGTSGDGFGCLYIGSACTGMYINMCEFSATKGIGIFSASRFLLVLGTNVVGGWSNAFGSVQNIGIMARSVRTEGARYSSLGTAFELIRGISQIEHVNVENCGVGAHIGQNRLAYWEPDAASGAGAVIAALSTSTDPLTGETWSHVPAGIVSLQFESPIIAAARLIDAYNLALNVTSESFAAAPDYGIYTERIRRCKISGTITGAYVTAAVALAQNSAKGGGNKIEGLSASNSSGTVWASLPPASHYNAGDDPYVFVNCPGQDGGVTRANLPPSPSAGGSTVYVVITDSDVPAWTGSVSNVGRPITGTGANRVLARWNSATSQWCVAG